MSKSSSDEEVLEKIHEILDNTSSESSEEKQDHYFSSLKRRISSNQSIPHSKRIKKYASDDNLKPRVVIRRREESKSITAEKEKNEAALEEKNDQVNIIPSPGVDVSDESLFEIEHPVPVTEDIPEFIEVKPKQNENGSTINQQEPLTVKVISENKEDDTLPQWHAVDEESKRKEKKKFSRVKSKKTSISPQRKHVKQPVSEPKGETIEPKKEKRTNDIWEPLPSEKKKEDSSKPSKHSVEKKIETFSEINDYNNETLSQKNDKIQQSEESTIDSNNQGYTYNGYHLYKKVIKISDDDSRTIHFFAKEPPETGEPADLPSGYEVKINRRTGVPYIRKKQK